MEGREEMDYLGKVVDDLRELENLIHLREMVDGNSDKPIRDMVLSIANRIELIMKMMETKSIIDCKGVK